MNQPFAGRAFAQPGLPQAGLGIVPPDEPGPPRQGTQCNEAERVVLAGGALNTLLVHSAILPFERLYRIDATEAMFDPDLAPSRPFTCTIGFFRVPSSFDLVVTDLRPDIYRYAGVGAGDTVPVEARRFSTAIGYDLIVDEQHPGNIELDVIPVPPQQGLAFAPGFDADVNAFAELVSQGINPFARMNIAAAQQATGAAGAGLSLLPQRPTRYGPQALPFSLYARSGQTVQVKAVVFRPMPMPIAFIEYDLAGLLLPSSWVRTMEECMKPLSNASGGPGSLGGGPR